MWFAIVKTAGQWHYQSAHKGYGLIDQMEPFNPSSMPKLCFEDETQIQLFLNDDSAPRWTNYVRSLRSLKHQNLVFTVDEILEYTECKDLVRDPAKSVHDFLLEMIALLSWLQFDQASALRRQPRWGTPYLKALQDFGDPNRFLIMEHLNILSLRKELENWDTFMAHDPETSECVWARHSIQMPEVENYAMAALPDRSGLRLMKPSTFGHTFSTPIPESLHGVHQTLYVPIPDSLVPILTTTREKTMVVRKPPLDVLLSQPQVAN